MSRYEEERARGEDPDGRRCARRCAGVLARHAGRRDRRVGGLRVADGHQLPRLLAVRRHGRRRRARRAGLATFTVLPALLVLLDTRRQPTAAPRHRARRSSWGRWRAFIRRCERARSACVLHALVSVAGVVRAAALPEGPVRVRLPQAERAHQPATAQRSSSTTTWTSCSGAGRRRPWSWPTASTRSSRSSRRSAAGRTTCPGRTSSATILTIYDVLPGPPDVAAAQAGADRADPQAGARSGAGELLNDKERADLAKIDPPDELRVLHPSDLPPLARRPFTENDGTIGRVVLVYHAEHGTFGLERARPAADRVRAAAPAPAERQGHRDVGQRRWSSAP